MNEIKCPHCNKTFTIDEDDYSKIVKQIKDKEFAKEISTLEKQYSQDKENSLKLLQVELEKKMHDELTKKELEFNNFKNEAKVRETSTKVELEKKFTDEINAKQLEITNLKNELKVKEDFTKVELEKKYSDELTKKELEISKLHSDIQLKEAENALSLKEKMAIKEKEIDTLNTKIESSKNEFLLKEKTLRDSYEDKLKDKDEQIAYYKDFKARQSTKMIGESLEQHCANEFNKLRPLFKNAYFEKDNDAKTGSKGDFIYKESSEDGTEFISIMFEMKNEADMTSTKHKNEDFFKELDKDRREKECEYAVLVSLLEENSDYYNAGIVDVSHKYDKMYVIRPQFFIPLITLLRGAALNSLQYRKELQIVKNQNIDISKFEENMNNFKEGFSRNYRLASEKFKKAIEEIDKTIDHLQKTKDALISSENNLRLANNKAEDLTIKRLTNNAPAVQEMFKNLMDD